MTKPETLEQRTARLRALRLERDKNKPKEPDKTEFYPVYGMKDRLLFGKHKGYKIETVLDKEPSWITWALSTVKGFAVDQDVEDELNERADPRRPLRLRR